MSKAQKSFFCFHHHLHFVDFIEMSFVVLKDAETKSAYYSPNYHLNMSLSLQDFGVTRSGVKYSLEAYLVSANIPGPKKTSQTFVISE